MEKRDNYKIQVQQAKRHFLTYDQKELIDRCNLRFDDQYFYVRFLGAEYRICRGNGDMERLSGDKWIDGNGFGEVMTLLDWLCDSSRERYMTGRYVNIVTQGHYFHRDLQEKKDPDAEYFSRHPDEFHRACRALGGEPASGADMAYTIELMDGLKVYIKLWHADEEFPPQLTILWEENVLRYIRYETTWFAVGLILQRIRENM